MNKRPIEKTRKRLAMYDKAWKSPNFNVKIRDQVYRYAVTLFK